MDFAKKQLEKYGWKEGKGLGKKEDGIQQALKPRPKHGSTGMGFDIAEEFTNHWWQKVYNNATNNIQVNKKDNGETESFATIKIEKHDIEKRTFKKSKKCLTNEKNEKKLRAYKNDFIKKATLSNGVTVVEKNEHNSEDSSDDSLADEDQARSDVSTVQKLTDEELFAACGGRTAHKGARHGLKSNGKLSRINEQEEKFLESFKAKICANGDAKTKQKPLDYKTYNDILADKDTVDNKSENEMKNNLKKLKRKKYSVESECISSEQIVDGNILRRTKRKKTK